MESNDADVHAWIETVTNPTRKHDALTLLAMMARVTGEEPRMWGPSIVGFGQYHYKYVSGREGDAAAAGFSPRKAAMTVYFPEGLGGYASQLTLLGPHTTGVACLYFKDFSTIDLVVLESMITESYRTVTSGEAFRHRAADSEVRRPGP